MAGVKGKSGGKRANSGRKSILLSDRMRKRVDSELRRARQEYSQSLERVVVNLAYGRNADGAEDKSIRPMDQIRAAQLVVQTQLVKEGYNTNDHTVTVVSPVFLPVMDEDPAKQRLDENAEPIEFGPDDLN